MSVFTIEIICNQNTDISILNADISISLGNMISLILIKISVFQLGIALFQTVIPAFTLKYRYSIYNKNKTYFK